MPGACPDATTPADDDLGGVLMGVLSSLPQPTGLTPDQATTFQNFRTNARGMWMSNNAQGFSFPDVDFTTHALVFDLAAPRLTRTGATNNGFFKLFLPNTLLTNFWGIADPTTVTGSTLRTTRRDGSVATVVSPTLTQASGGVILQLDPFDFSPSFSIAPA